MLFFLALAGFWAQSLVGVFESPEFLLRHA
jgi:hypothetical protein